MTILFWNTYRKNLSHLVGAIAADQDADIVILAENGAGMSASLLGLNECRCGGPYKFEFSASRRLSIFSRLPHGHIRPVFDEGGVGIRLVKPIIGPEFLLVAVHLPSKREYTTRDQAALCPRIRAHIATAEQEHSNPRTVVVGDFNMDPFEDGMVDSEGFHAVPSRYRAKKGHRTIQGETRTFFYNPSWSHFGEWPQGSPGTHHYVSSTPICHFWHMYDQVLIRPDLLDCFNDASLRIVTRAGDTSLVRKNGVPNITQASDHLPICFSLDMARFNGD